LEQVGRKREREKESAIQKVEIARCSMKKPYRI